MSVSARFLQDSEGILVNWFICISTYILSSKVLPPIITILTIFEKVGNLEQYHDY